VRIRGSFSRIAFASTFWYSGSSAALGPIAASASPHAIAMWAHVVSIPASSRSAAWATSFDAPAFSIER
jgi:hypothetical protein